MVPKEAFLSCVLQCVFTKSLVIPFSLFSRHVLDFNKRSASDTHKTNKFLHNKILLQNIIVWFRSKVRHAKGKCVSNPSRHHQDDDPEDKRKEITLTSQRKEDECEFKGRQAWTIGIQWRKRKLHLFLLAIQSHAWLVENERLHKEFNERLHKKKFCIQQIWREE